MAWCCSQCSDGDHVGAATESGLGYPHCVLVSISSFRLLKDGWKSIGMFGKGHNLSKTAVDKVVAT